jgi:hypothetical protein
MEDKVQRVASLPQCAPAPEWKGDCQVQSQSRLSYACKKIESLVHVCASEKRQCQVES